MVLLSNARKNLDLLTKKKLLRELLCKYLSGKCKQIEERKTAQCNLLTLLNATSKAPKFFGRDLPNILICAALVLLFIGSLCVALKVGCLSWEKAGRSAQSYGFKDLGTIGPFDEGMAELAIGSTGSAVQDMRNNFVNFAKDKRAGSIAVFVVGSADKRDLKEGLKKTYGGNEGLARARSEYVIAQLRSTTTGAEATFIPLMTGPAWHGPIADPKTAEDRVVKMYVVWGSSE